MANTATVLPAVPEQTKIEIQSVADMADEVKSLVITDNNQYQHAANMLSQLKERGKLLEKKRKEITEPLDAAKKATMDMFRPANDAIADCERELKNRMGNYVREQERLQRQREAEAAERARKEQEKLEAQAERARARGQEEKAQALETQAATAVAVVKPVEAPRASGAHTRKAWKARLNNKMQLITAVAQGKASPELLEYNERAGNDMAKALTAPLNCPGVEAFEEIQVVSR